MSGNDVISSLERLTSTFAHVWVIQSYSALLHINYILWDPHIGLVLVFAPRWAVQTEQLFHWLRLMAWPEFNLLYKMDLAWWETEEGIPVCSISLVGPNITQKDELFITPTGKIICFLFFLSWLSYIYLLVGNSIFRSVRCWCTPRCCEVPIPGYGSIQLIIDLFGHVLLCSAVCTLFYSAANSPTRARLLFIGSQFVTHCSNYFRWIYFAPSSWL